MADDITETGADGGMPEETPVDELTGLKTALDKERADRKTFEKEAKRAKALEAELAKLREAGQTEAEKAIAKAREEAAAQARGEVLSTVGQRLVRAEIRAAAAGKVADIDALLEDLNLAKFLTDDGEPDSKAIGEAVKRWAKAAPAEKTPPFNGGARKTAETNDMNRLIRQKAGLG
ncbi:hypothetical protein [Streptosporangium sandarakinum]